MLKLCSLLQSANTPGNYWPGEKHTVLIKNFDVLFCLWEQRTNRVHEQICLNNFKGNGFKKIILPCMLFVSFNKMM